MASFALSATTCGARKHVWTKKSVDEWFSLSYKVKKWTLEKSWSDTRLSVREQSKSWEWTKEEKFGMSTPCNRKKIRSKNLQEEDRKWTNMAISINSDDGVCKERDAEDLVYLIKWNDPGEDKL